MSDFYKYFKENMEALGLTPPPESLFGTQQLALGSITTMLTYIDKFGTKVTVLEWYLRARDWNNWLRWAPWVPPTMRVQRSAASRLRQAGQSAAELR